MKKIVSVVLALIMLVSAFAISVNAEGTNILESVVVKFAISDRIDGKGTIIDYKPFDVSTSLNEEQYHFAVKLYEYDSYVEYDEEKGIDVKYYFVGWYDPDTGKVRTTEALPVPTQDKTYVAVFEPDYEAENGITLLSFFSTFLERFNRILEYFYKIFFEGLN